MITIIFAASIFILLSVTFASFFSECYEGKDITKQECKEPILPENELFKVMMDSVSKGWDIFADEKELILTHKDFSFSIQVYGYGRDCKRDELLPVHCDYNICGSDGSRFGAVLFFRLNSKAYEESIMTIACKIKSTPEIEKYLDFKEINLIIKKILSTDNPVVKAVVDEEEGKRLKEKQKLIDLFK